MLMASQGYLLELNKAVPLFIPSNQELNILEPRVVQVMVRTLGFARKNEQLSIWRTEASVDDRVVFYCSQAEITKTVEAIVVGHLICSLPEYMVLEGEGYILHARRKKWDVGDLYKFRWGDEVVRAAEDKWTFELVLTTKPDKAW